MRQLTKLTADAKQNYTLIGEKGEQIPFFLQYLPTQNCWLFDISYNNFALNGAILRVSPNVLNNYKKVLPFGIMCSTTTGSDPQNIDDFVSGRNSLFLLNQDELTLVEQDFYS